MADISFDDLIKAAQKLTPQQKQQLILSLHDDFEDFEPTREQLIAELDALRAAGAFDGVESLRDAYATPALEHVTDDQL